MEPTDKQLTDLWFLIDDYTGETTVGERMRMAWDFVAHETGSTKLIEISDAAHNLCRVKGRHNSEIAMRRLMLACGFEVPNVKIEQLPNTKG
ncbi:MAG: hypothetical protein PHE88_11775 [Elusimicrobia bacterium]|nr:hypothetical protein [Elusimicrobiota bacterium]